MAGRLPDTAGRFHDMAGKFRDMAGKFHDMAGEFCDMAGRLPDMAGRLCGSAVWIRLLILLFAEFCRGQSFRPKIRRGRWILGKGVKKMREHHGYLPDKESELTDWLDNFVEKLQTNAAKWQVPQAEADEIAALTAAFKAKHAACAGPDRSKTLVAEKDAAKRTLTAKIRALVKFRFANPSIPDEDRVSAGLRAHDKTRTPIGIPASRCLITDLKPLGGFRAEIHFQDETSPGSRAVPYGCNGALLNYAFGPEKIGGYALLTSTKLITSSPYILELPPEAEGAFLSAACRWQNNKGELGPWSEIMYMAIS
jgi:hypothetical protein